MASAARKLARLKQSTPTVRQLINYLHYCFEAGDIEVAFNGGSSKIALADLLVEYPLLGDKAANRVRVRFFGGPPHETGFFNGTILTVFEDCVLRAAAHGRQDLLKRFTSVKL